MLKIMSRYLKIILLISSIILYKSALADFKIVIQKEVASAQPIAIVPFQGTASFDATEIIANDLRYTGKFNPIPASSMPQRPTTANEVNPSSWTPLGVGVVVVGQITPMGNNYNIKYQAIDTTGSYTQVGGVIIEGSYTADNNQVRYAAHTISDQIFEKLTNIKGAARTRIAYVVQSGIRSYNLTVSDYDGFNSFVVYRSSQPIMRPAWSADGKNIVFSSFEGKKSQLILQNLASGKRSLLSKFNGYNGAPSFSPNGRWLAFAASENDGKLNIYLSSPNGSGLVKLTSSGNNTEPSWTADSNSILFTSDMNGRPEIYKMDINSKSISKISGGINTFSASMSADNKNVVMIKDKSLVANNLETGAITPISDTYLDESPSISPNGLMVIYNATQGVSKSLQLVSIDGNFRARIPSPSGEVKYPAWSPFLINN